MPALTIRKLDEATYARLSARAKRNNRSLEAEVREILKSGAQSFDLEAWLDQAKALRRHTPRREDGKTSLDLLRDERDIG